MRETGFPHRAGRRKESASSGCSFLKNPTKILLFSLAVLVVLIITVVIFSSGNPSLKINGRSYKLIVAKTSAEQTKGLGERASLPANQGMLFVFNSSAERCFWMKGMQFPLDIIWLSASKQVVFAQANLSPSTYPKSFCPQDPARYVIELNAGQAKQANIKIGQKLQF
ncbi:MAG: DUF192 domain-containing protein [Candidatus Saccharimonadales bacterium]